MLELLKSWNHRNPLEIHETNENLRIPLENQENLAKNNSMQELQKSWNKIKLNMRFIDKNNIRIQSETHENHEKLRI